MKIDIEFKSQMCTTKEQSERLLALGLKQETADMVLFKTYDLPTYPFDYIFNQDPSSLTKIRYVPTVKGESLYIQDGNIPAWSLHRLIEIADTRAFSPVSSINGLYDEIIAQIQSLIHIGYIDEKYLNMDIVNVREEKNMELLKNN